MKIKHLKRTLLEAAEIKSLDTMSEDEFADLINDVMSRVDQVDKITYSTDIDSRVEKIKADAADKNKQDELRQEDDWNRAEERRKKTREAEKAKYQKVGGYQGLQAFKDSLESAIRLQVSTVEEEDDTYAEPNKRFAHDDDMLVKGTRLDDVQGDVPAIDVYFDLSPSWEDEDLEIGRDAISCLVEMEAEGLIDLNIYYFANSISDKEELIRGQRGTGAWPRILNQIKQDGATNVVVMTDADMDSQPFKNYHWVPRDSYPTVRVSGGVWWLWRNGVAGTKIVKELQGDMQPSGGEQFSFARAR